jgi:hypothetical protein
MYTPCGSAQAVPVTLHDTVVLRGDVCTGLVVPDLALVGHRRWKVMQVLRVPLDAIDAEHASAMGPSRVVYHAAPERLMCAASDEKPGCLQPCKETRDTLGRLHGGGVDDLPAREFLFSGRREWFACGRRHRDADLPAITTPWSQEWFHQGT